MKLLIGVLLVAFAAGTLAACDKDHCIGVAVELEKQCCGPTPHGCTMLDRDEVEAWCRQYAEDHCGDDEERVAGRLTRKVGNTCYLELWCE